MALDAFLDSNYSREMPRVVTSFFSKASSNLPSTDAGISHFNLDKYCNAAYQTTVHSANNLTYDIADSYLVPESISAVSKDPQLHRTSTTNLDSHVDFFKLPVL
ncbi:hypothetical protein CRYUN_Cryun13aG0123400 [Craigia yunnanensis]